VNKIGLQVVHTAEGSAADFHPGLWSEQFRVLAVPGRSRTVDLNLNFGVHLEEVRFYSKFVS